MLSGEILHTLMVEEWPEFAGQASIKDDMLAVPGMHDKKLHLFKINRGLISTTKKRNY